MEEQEVDVKELIRVQNRNKWIMFSLDALLIVLAISVYYNGLSPCDKCKLTVSKHNLNQTLSCKDLAYSYINSTGLLQDTPIIYDGPKLSQINLTLNKN